MICHSGTFSRRKVCISILVSDNLTSCPLRVYFRVIDQEIDNIGVSKRVYFSEYNHYCVYFHHCTSFSKIRIKCIKFGDICGIWNYITTIVNYIISLKYHMWYITYQIPRDRISKFCTDQAKTQRVVIICMSQRKKCLYDRTAQLKHLPLLLKATYKLRTYIMYILCFWHILIYKNWTITYCTCFNRLWLVHVYTEERYSLRYAVHSQSS